MKKKEIRDLNEEYTEMEFNLKMAINDLIEESDYKNNPDSNVIGMIITHLARAAASIREKKQSDMGRA
ncbi:MAG: hypothetical protein GF308_08710 [Candidatus Heimdallarchaeota archaeon]|nr:hypothetical protein [Candidatus Heimdallarchaeota archaeon]